MSRARRSVRISGVIPAAGMSRRMGTPKQVLPWGRTTMVGAVTQALLDAGLDVVVVVSRTPLLADMNLRADPRVRTVVNDDAGSEMIDSIRIGLAHLGRLAESGRPVAGAVSPTDDDGVLITPADMPGLRANVCRACMEAYRADPSRIVVATHAGRRGHPIIFPYSLKATVEKLSEGLRQLLAVCSDRVVHVETGDPGVTRDVDTPFEYGRWNNG